MTKDIKILHSSCCASGSPIKAQIEQAAQNAHIDVTIEELSELADTMVYGTMAFPSIVINGKVFNYRQFQSEQELATVLKAN